MKKLTLLTLLTVLFSGCIQEEAERPKPNVLLIVTDDLGWTDLEVYGSTFYETPTLNKLAENGIMFTNGYATCPVCSPSRASIQTGKYPVQSGITDWIPGRKTYASAKETDRWIAADTQNELDTTETTIAEYLKQEGYKTMFAGKWHLGKEGYYPQDQGYDVNKGGYHRGAPNLRPQDDCYGYFSPYCNEQLEDGPKGEYLPERLAQEVNTFISETPEQPFYINLSFYLVHTPLQAKEELIDKYEEKRAAIDTVGELVMETEWMANATPSNSYKERIKQAHPTYAAMMQALDDNIKAVLDQLEAAGKLENTLVIFTSDNGGLSTAEGSPTSNLPLRAGKGWLYEGGIRVPYIVKLPEQQMAGTQSDMPVTGADILPLIMGQVNPAFKAPEPVDGVNILAYMDDPADRPLYWHYPHYSNQGGNPGSAIRFGDYKLIDDFETGKVELYNLADDIGEQNNLADELPKIREELYNLLDTWRKNNKAMMMEKENEAWVGWIEEAPNP